MKSIRLWETGERNSCCSNKPIHGVGAVLPLWMNRESETYSHSRHLAMHW
jgi:hypothetical protein